MITINLQNRYFETAAAVYRVLPHHFVIARASRMTYYHDCSSESQLHIQNKFILVFWLVQLSVVRIPI